MSIVVACAKHPEVQTGLRCSRCETPICPKCLIQTPVGARCRDCARIVKSPIYTLDRLGILKAATASVIGGVVAGLAWWLVLLPFTVGFFSIFLGAGLGIALTKLLDFATGRKRGTLVVAFAIMGIAIAWSMQVVLVGPRFALYGLVAVGVLVGQKR